ncbi:benzoate/H(+) symporter BenE family transporter [Stenotrophomonas maltophilia]|uniref:benzoate/H(+) symporter BenE family transporter n=1 Tax=Stenotrophomonas maltophilia TaxID=40324 RepID=UPI0034E2166B
MNMQVRQAWWRDLSVPALVAGFITVLVGFASSAVIVFQAAQAVGANQAQIASWMWALGLGMGVTCIGLSLRYRVPVVTAWSTPGAAMLVVGAGGASLSEATGAFLLAAVLGMLAGFSGIFARLMQRVPMALAAGMLAGVLLRFGLDVFVAMNTLAAITAAICMGRDAHEDPARRYTAAMAAGAFYIVIGLFGATVAALFAAFPKELVACVAGIALFGTIANSLASALAVERDREAALVTFLVTASGVSLAGIGQLVLALAMFATWLAGRRLFPRYAVIATLLVGIAIAASRGLLHAQQVQLQLAVPQWVTPSLSWTAVAGIALPLFVVTMASQNIPGVAVMRASGYDAPVSPLIGWIGVVNTLLAPFGAYALNSAFWGLVAGALCLLVLRPRQDR